MRLCGGTGLFNRCVILRERVLLMEDRGEERGVLYQERRHPSCILGEGWVGISHRKCFQVIHQIIQGPNCDKPDVPTLFLPACRLT